jgi:DNA-binding transcriptional regulator YiaG
MTTDQLENTLTTLSGRARLLEQLPPVENREQMRRQLGVSLSEFARILGVAWITAKRIEAGASIPRGDVLVNAARFYAVAAQGGVEHGA